MHYIDREVRATCAAKGWSCQIRRKWSEREKPCAESVLDDYEWKLIPCTAERPPDATSAEAIQDTYFLLSYDEKHARFLLQHDTYHCGMMGPHWRRNTFTEIHTESVATEPPLGLRALNHERSPLPDGWLKDHLMELTERFQPNVFSAT
jgi:hypothetical protein